MNIIGIDYGSKLAGTTVIAHLNAKGSLQFYQSEKKKDADQFLKTWINKLQPSKIYMDAPLSLPGVYSKPQQFQNYFYREADTALKGMSPMFLGGLTARAMKLKAELKAFTFIEIYPSALVDHLKIDRNLYKKQKEHIPEVLATLNDYYSFISSSQQVDSLNNWHQVDALLALISGYRHQKNICIYYGNDYEGFICI